MTVRRINQLLLTALLGAGVLAACTETKEVFVDLPDYEDPPAGAAGFLGYTNSESSTPVCGNCHVGQYGEWKGTHHASAWADLQDSGHAAENASCGPCHEARGIFAAWGIKADYLEKDQADPIAIGCPVCHDPHDPTNAHQLRFPINEANVETNLCMKCHHRRSVPDPTSSRGPHSPQGPLLIGEDVGWVPPNFTYPEKISGTHGSSANPELCAACHVSRTEVVDQSSGGLIFNSTGHLFKAIACLDSQGIPTTDDSCDLTQRNFTACAVSGCHGSQESARSALTTVWGRFDLLSETINDLLAQVPSSEFVTGDNLITTAEGAKFNVALAELEGSAAHNPFLVEALLTASIKQLQTDYGLKPPPDVTLDNVIGAAHQ